MRISELADATEVSVATIKYYLRESLLHPGHKVAERMAEYDETHVRRLGLLRVLREVGDVPVDRLRLLVAVAEGNEGTVHEMFAKAAETLAPVPSPAGPGRAESRAIADSLIEQAGWTAVREDSVDRDNLAATLEVMLRYGTHTGDPSQAAPYLEVADRIAQHEIANLDATKGRVELLEQMVVGQVVFGQFLSVVRRLAEEHYSSERFGEDSGNVSASSDD